MTMTTTDAGPADHSGEASHALGLIGWLHLAAAPTFATMALLNTLTITPVDILCSAGDGMPSLGGMTLMYALMGVFHAGPWWRLIASRRGRGGCRNVETVRVIPHSKSERRAKGAQAAFVYWSTAPAISVKVCSIDLTPQG